MMDFKLFCLLLCFALIQSVKKGKLALESSNIIGANNKRIWQRPYLASLERIKRRINFCVATFLGGPWLVAAAHCTMNFTKKEIQARMGSSFRIRGGDTYGIRTLIPHEKYDPKTTNHDILLIELQMDVRVDNKNIKSIPIADPFDTHEQGDIMTISGWGFIDVDSSILSDNLKSADVRVLDNSICISNYRHLKKPVQNPLNPGEFCATATSASPCLADSGGPGIIKGKLAGVLSRGNIKCQKSEMPMILTEISFHYYWIAGRTHLYENKKKL